MKRIIITVFPCLLLLTACMGPAPIKDVQPSHAGQVKLVEAAGSISHSLVDLARIQETATPPVRSNLPDPMIRAMPQIATIDWSGPIGPLVTRIAQAAKYQVRVLGTRPAIPVIVTIDTRNTPLGNILRDAAYQAGTRAHVKVFPKRRIIELRYAKL
jgi:defect in organelle trafficking protein DotD